MQRNILFLPRPWGPEEGSKGQIAFVFQLQSKFQRFLYPTLCLLSHIKDTKPIRRDLWGWGCPGGQTFLFKHDHMAYQIDEDEKQNRMQVKFSTKGQTGDLGVRSKGQI